MSLAKPFDFLSRNLNKIAGSVFAIWSVASVTVLAPRFVDRYEYTRVNLWLKAAECSALTGKVLVACDEGGRLIPIEDLSLADDRGHSLAIGALAAITGEPAAKVTLVRFNFLITALALLMTAFALSILAPPGTAPTFLLLGTLFFLPGPLPGPDVIASYPALTGLGLSAGLFVFAGANPFSAKTVYFSALTALILAMVFLLREPIGLMGLLATFLALALIAKNLKRQNYFRSLGVLVALGGCFLITKTLPSQLLGLRSWLYEMPRGKALHSHGLAHNLYLGLGSEPNAFGITWSDEFAAARVNEVAPGTEYVSPEYYAVLKGLYIDAIRSQPLEAGRVYSKKFFKALSYPATPLRLPFIVLLLLGVWLVGRSQRLIDPSLRPIFILLAAMTALCLAQGVLARPSRTFLYGADWLLIVFISIGLAPHIIRPRGCNADA